MSSFPFEYIPNFLSPEECKAYMAKFSSYPWESGDIVIYGKKHKIPRLQCWFGDEKASYSYSGIDMNVNSWTSELLEIKCKLERETGSNFNSVLMNLYRDGQDSNGWHRDNEPELGSDPIIASISLGETRKFKVRNRITKKVADFILTPGSFLLMKSGSQIDWEHCLPKSKRKMGHRINLTFREIKKESG